MEIDLIRAENIAKLNDICRKNAGMVTNARLVITANLQYELDEIGAKLDDVLMLVANYNTFNEDNDPRKERDYWRFVYKGLNIIRKINYYDLNLQYHSPDETDPTQTIRVMTVMLASDR